MPPLVTFPARDQTTPRTSPDCFLINCGACLDPGCRCECHDDETGGAG